MYTHLDGGCLVGADREGVLEDGDQDAVDTEGGLDHVRCEDLHVLGLCHALEEEQIV